MGSSNGCKPEITLITSRSFESRVDGPRQSKTRRVPPHNGSNFTIASYERRQSSKTGIAPGCSHLLSFESFVPQYSWKKCETDRPPPHSRVAKREKHSLYKRHWLRWPVWGKSACAADCTGFVNSCSCGRSHDTLTSKALPSSWVEGRGRECPPSSARTGCMWAYSGLVPCAGIIRSCYLRLP